LNHPFGRFSVSQAFTSTRNASASGVYVNISPFCPLQAPKVHVEKDQFPFAHMAMRGFGAWRRVVT
jgi:hypothetical protein